MPHTTRSAVPVTATSTVALPGRRRWIDLALVAAGGALALEGLVVLGAVLLVVGLLLPFLEWRARRVGGIDHLLDLVPRELADAHRAISSAAGRPGTPDPGEVLACADELVLEVAAVLGGRPVVRASHRRFVEIRVAALQSVAADLAERHEAWRAAMDELDALAPVDTGEIIAEVATPPGWLPTLLLVVLAPAFLLVDLVRGAARSTIVLVQGVALRLRTVADLALAGLRAIARAIGDALTSWRALMATTKDAARAARGRFVAARALAMHRLRRTRRIGRIPS